MAEDLSEMLLELRRREAQRHAAQRDSPDYVQALAAEEDLARSILRVAAQSTLGEDDGDDVRQ